MPEINLVRNMSLPTVSPDLTELLEKNKALEEEIRSLKAENIELKQDIAQKISAYVFIRKHLDVGTD
jgi:hypothetical protein